MVDDFFAIFPSSWNIHQLDEVANIIDSLHKTPQYSDIGYPMVRVTDLKGGFLDLSSTFKVAEDVFKEFTRRHKPKCGDIILSRVGTYGNASYVETDMPFCLGQNTALISPIIDSRFLYFCLQSPLLRHQIENVAVGSTQKTISLKSIGELKIPVPPKEEMEAIAHILGTLDDKIELNRRMNETLEGMARAIFKSWFVDFDPVRAKAEGRDTGLPEEIADLFPDSFEETELGEVPKGWKVVPLNTVCTCITDGAHHSPKSVEIGYPMASVKDMNASGFDLSTCRLIAEQDYHLLVVNGCKPLVGDVLIAKDGSYLKHIFVVEKDLDLVILSSIAILRPNERIDSHLLAFSLKSEQTLSRMEQYVSGAVLQRIVLKDFRIFPILLPPKSIQKAWIRFLESLIFRIWRNADESRTLAELRDTLLPKLISGKLRANDVKTNQEHIA